MGDVISFPRGIDIDIDELLDRIETGGFMVSVIRNEHNWKGDLAFTILGTSENSDALPAMQALHRRFEADEKFRLRMYEEAFALGSLYYEASTSNALAFHEKPMPAVGGAQ